MSITFSILLALCLAIVFAVATAVVKSRYVSFWAQKPEDYPADGPQFDIRQKLNGPIVCEGVIFGPLGRVSSRFVADFEALDAQADAVDPRAAPAVSQLRREALRIGLDRELEIRSG